MHLTFTIVCIVGPMVPALEAVEAKIKSQYGNHPHPYSCDVERALDEYFKFIDKKHLSKEQLRSSCVDVENAVSRMIGAYEPLFRSEERPKRNVFVTGFPFTTEQARHLRDAWPDARLVIHFLDSHDGETWENDKESLKAFLDEIADEFVLETDPNVCMLSQ